MALPYDLLRGSGYRFRSECPGLDFHGRGRFTIVAWVRRGAKSNRQCEFLAGQWNETGGGRQYGLFLNISVWQQPEAIFGLVSATGGPTPGYKYCMDGAQGATQIELNEWHCLAIEF